ncbi:glutathione synthetase-like [Lineus longissimus]|uniref:glutathione synthetase-like n=1 Tax=Lineus longissimus TaxID=88925 RepID=UPI002B4DCE0B
MADDHHNISVQLSEERLTELVDFAKDYAVGHGVIMRLQDQQDEPEKVTIPPMTLLPSPIKRTLFNFGKQIQTDYNLLYHRVAHDYDFLKDAFGKIRETDDFIRRLFELYQIVLDEGGMPSICLEISRSDYMVDRRKEDGPGMIKQIEYNTIACSMAGLATAAYDCHKFLLEKLGRSGLATHLPVNTANDGLAEGMVSAWELYNAEESVILFLVEPFVYNIYDVQQVETAIKKVNEKVQVVLATFLEVNEKATLTEDKRLILNGQEVAVVYYRTGYVPQNYCTEKEWNAKTMMERSKAVKCPAVNYQLAGMKKIQQVLCEPGMVEKFIEDPDAASDVRETFAYQYSLDGPEGDSAIQLAMESPEKYVLKPQREGGGHNIYSDDIPKLLDKIKDTEERNNYILMELIHPLENHNYIMKANALAYSGDVISELGIFGVLISSGDTILRNNTVGHLLRTKPVGISEGGIASGAAGLDSPYLV